jgi:D-glycero-alpha-D-manno-heptose 1-phosphate guanylyltransferase
MIEDIDVFILCGGKGKRLKRVSGGIPKPMVRIGKLPFLDIVINYLKRSGFKRLILGIGYKAHFIKKYYNEHKIPGIKIIFSQEDRPLGTGGAVKKARRLIKSKVFLVLNGDSFSEFDAESFIKFYQQKKAKALILLRKEKNKRDFGGITIDKSSAITCFSEKNPELRNNFINCGVYLFSRNIFSMMPKNAQFSLEYDFFPGMAGKGLYGHKKPGFFIDIGTPERYFAAKKHFLKN